MGSVEDWRKGGGGDEPGNSCQGSRFRAMGMDKLMPSFAGESKKLRHGAEIRWRRSVANFQIDGLSTVILHLPDELPQSFA